MKIYKISQRKIADISDLGQYVDKDYSIHFSDLPKIGINPQSKYDTPIAICGYPLTSNIYNQLIDKELPFAQDKKYMHLYRVKDAFNVDNYTEEKYEEDLNKILELIKSNPRWKRKINYDDSLADQHNIYKLKSFGYTDREPKPFSTMWNIGRLLCENSRKWNGLLRALRYNAIVDLGHGILHPNEPNQTMVLNPSNIEEVKYYISPMYHEKKVQDKVIQNNLKPFLNKISILKENKNLKDLAQEVKNFFNLYKESEIINLILKSVKNENLLYALSFHENPEIRINVANKTESEEILIRLANDSDVEVKRSAILHLPVNEKTKPLMIECVIFAGKQEASYPYFISDILSRLDKQDIPNIALSSIQAKVREEAIQFLYDRETLETIIKDEYEESYIRQAAQDQLNLIEQKKDDEEDLNRKYLEMLETIKNFTDQEKLKEIAAGIGYFFDQYVFNFMDDAKKDARKTAVESITDIKILEDLLNEFILQNNSEAEELYNLAQDRILKIKKNKTDDFDNKIAQISRSIDLFYKIIQGI